jgi:hypothetical protein
MRHNFMGTLTFYHPETKEMYYVTYRGYYIPFRDSFSFDKSLTLIDLPADLVEYEDLIKEDIWDYELHHKDKSK